jgi:epoxyqueuosine reductase
LDRLAVQLREKAAQLGFDDLAITRPDAIPQAPQRLAQFLADGHHGSMGWMAETADRRASPSVLWPDVRSVIMLAMNYGPAGDALENLAHPYRGNISVYARHRDYHDVIKGKLKELASFLVSRAGGGDVKVFVDTAPVMEKPLAQAAGLGWQGKHTNLVSRKLGSWFFLASIFTTLDLAAAEPEPDHCGSCRACLSACPTGAFPQPYRLDARRCISYLTIEHAGPIPDEFRVALGNRIYGCDDCLAACPWNKFAVEAREAKLQAREDLEAPSLAALLKLDDPAFRQLFSGSPVKRIGRDRFIRNCLIAAGNSADAGHVPQIMALLDDPAAVVRGAAVWALSRLLSPEAFMALAQERLGSEADADVCRELRAGMSLSA